MPKLLGREGERLKGPTSPPGLCHFITGEHPPGQDPHLCRVKSAKFPGRLLRAKGGERLLGVSGQILCTLKSEL